MAFGIYVHIPFCLQICPYCDFTKYELGRTISPSDYVELVRKEIRERAKSVKEKTYDTLYFGGGTPSLLEPSLILSLIEELANAGFEPSSRSELTIEIDPKTVDRAKLESYLAIGLNRFSVGAQSFNDRHLKMMGRQHASGDIRELLKLLQSLGVNYSFDLLFAMPAQSLDDLKLDLKTALEFQPPHLSPYCLTLPEAHRLNQGRAPDDDQVAMFEEIETQLARHGYDHYEISNFAKPGFESRHNLLYWNDQSYLGLGLSSHSYDAKLGPWGRRFWNSRAMKTYGEQVRDGALDLPDQREDLMLHQSLTDFCHTSLRRKIGLDINALRRKFPEAAVEKVTGRLNDALAKGSEALVEQTADGFCLTRSGRRLSNIVFEQLTFLPDDFGS